MLDATRTGLIHNFKKREFEPALVRKNHWRQLKLQLEQIFEIEELKVRLAERQVQVQEEFDKSKAIENGFDAKIRNWHDDIAILQEERDVEEYLERFELGVKKKGGNGKRHTPDRELIASLRAAASQRSCCEVEDEVDEESEAAACCKAAHDVINAYGVGRIFVHLNPKASNKLKDVVAHLQEMKTHASIDARTSNRKAGSSHAANLASLQAVMRPTWRRCTTYNNCCGIAAQHTTRVSGTHHNRDGTKQ